MKKETFALNEAVSVFDQKGIITEVVDETRKPFLYGVTFNDTQKTYTIEAGHIEAEKDNRPITERIKTFEDACKELGEEHPFVKEWSYWQGCCSVDLAAYLKVRIIVAALNEGWTPKFENGEWRYAPWYELLTNEEIEELDEDEKKNVCRVVGRASSHASAHGGLVYSHANYVSTISSTLHGSRLAFKTKELAEYAGKQFIEIFAVLAF